MKRSRCVREQCCTFPPGVIHGAVGKMRVLVIGIPDIDDSDVYFVDEK
jgi:hypothetical protein